MGGALAHTESHIHTLYLVVSLSVLDAAVTPRAGCTGLEVCQLEEGDLFVLYFGILDLCV